MVKDICWEVSETVIPDLPAWLNIALKSQLTGHKAGDVPLPPPGGKARSQAVCMSTVLSPCSMSFSLTLNGKRCHSVIPEESISVPMGNGGLVLRKGCSFNAN